MKQYFDIRFDRADFLRDFHAAHARHDDIGDEQVDVTWVAACDVEGFRAIRGGDHLIAVPGEDPLGYLSEGIFVLDYQDGLSVGCPLAGYGFSLPGRLPQR